MDRRRNRITKRSRCHSENSSLREELVVSKSGRRYKDLGTLLIHWIAKKAGDRNQILDYLENTENYMIKTKKMQFNIIHFACLGKNHISLKAILDFLRNQTYLFYLKKDDKTALEKTNNLIAEILNYPFLGGDTALHITAQENDIECAKLLLKNGADKRKPGIKLETPLQRALENGNPDSNLIDLLLGAKEEKIKKFRETPSHHRMNVIELEPTLEENLLKIMRHAPEIKREIEENGKIKPNRPKKFECPVCLETGQRKNFAMLKNCTHEICKSCVRRLFGQPCPICREPITRLDTIF